jgi:hypothetical protein
MSSISPVPGNPTSDKIANITFKDLSTPLVFITVLQATIIVVTLVLFFVRNDFVPYSMLTSFWSSISCFAFAGFYISLVKANREMELSKPYLANIVIIGLFSLVIPLTPALTKVLTDKVNSECSIEAQPYSVYETLRSNNGSFSTMETARVIISSVMLLFGVILMVSFILSVKGRPWLFDLINSGSWFITGTLVIMGSILLWLNGEVLVAMNKEKTC